MLLNCLISGRLELFLLDDLCGHFYRRITGVVLVFKSEIGCAIKWITLMASTGVARFLTIQSIYLMWCDEEAVSLKKSIVVSSLMYWKLMV